jgi:hypothetical protein
MNTASLDWEAAHRLRIEVAICVNVQARFNLALYQSMLNNLLRTLSFGMIGKMEDDADLYISWGRQDGILPHLLKIYI